VCYVPGFFPLLALHLLDGPHQNKAIIQDPKSTFSQLVEHFGKQKELIIPNYIPPPHENSKF
jgi:hypothetical protein